MYRPITQERCDDFGKCTTFVSHYEYDTYCTSSSASQFEVYRTTMLDYSVDLIKSLNQGTLYDSVIQTEKENELLWLNLIYVEHMEQKILYAVQH